MAPPSPSSQDLPTSFAGGRYQFKKFLGEGGKKKVYVAHDSVLDRDVAFAIIKTEGLDETSRTRVSREAQAMGRLGTHPQIVTVFDLGLRLEAHNNRRALAAGVDAAINRDSHAGIPGRRAATDVPIN